jgi:hypothetical protein
MATMIHAMMNATAMSQSSQFSMMFDKFYFISNSLQYNFLESYLLLDKLHTRSASFCNLYFGQEMERRDVNEADVLPLHHLNGSVLVHHNYLTKSIPQFFLPCSLYDVPLKKYNVAAFHSVLDLVHLYGLCFLAITITFIFKNNQMKPDQISYTNMLPTALMWPIRASTCARVQPPNLPFSLHQAL